MQSRLAELVEEKREAAIEKVEAASAAQGPHPPTPAKEVKKKHVSAFAEEGGDLVRNP